MKTSVTINLEMPIQVGGLQTSQLTFRRPKYRDFRFMGCTAEKRGQQAAADEILCNLASITPEELDELDPLDIEKLGSVMEEFGISTKK